MPAGALTVAALAAGLSLAACSSGSPRPAVTITVTRAPASTRVPASRQAAASPRKAAPPPVVTAPAQVASLFCKVERDSSGLEYSAQATVASGSAYVGNVSISFYDYPGSGHIFPGTELSPDATVTPSRPWITWQPVPAADVGASAEPAGCTASAG